ncbi:hypothetical protein [Streptococcus pneumoniae]|nr:hypothetical protein [Streptococcus pneumoniae]
MKLTWFEEIFEELTWFEEIFEEYNTNLEYKQPICSQEKGLDN